MHACSANATPSGRDDAPVRCTRPAIEKDMSRVKQPLIVKPYSSIRRTTSALAHDCVCAPHTAVATRLPDSALNDQPVDYAEHTLTAHPSSLMTVEPLSRARNLVSRTKGLSLQAIGECGRNHSVTRLPVPVNRWQSSA